MEVSSNSVQVVREFRYGITVVSGCLVVNGAKRGPGHWVEFNGVPLTAPDKEEEALYCASVFEQEFDGEHSSQVAPSKA